MSIPFISNMIFVVILYLTNAFTDTTVPIYYISDFPLHWSASDEYCNLKCNSDLASIHNPDQIGLISQNIQTIYDYDAVWIGLHKSDENSSYEWVDGTVFNDTLFDLDDEIWTENCSILTRNTSANDANWYMNDTSCDKSYPFICNSCDGVINKYILGPYYKREQSHADLFCNQTYQTSLASIHSQSDFQEVVDLCEIYGKTPKNRCWIGLSADNEENDWRWTDKTDFNFASNISAYPWKNTQNNEKCAYIHYTKISQNDYEWRISTALCNTTRAYAICNRPSALCDNELLVLRETAINSDKCNAYFMGDSGKNMILLSESQWVNKPTIFIEMMFTISSINESDGDAGLIISYTDIQHVGCGYLYVGISLDDNIYSLFIGAVMESNVIPYESEPLDTDLLREYNLLNITVTRTINKLITIFISVTINNLITITHQFEDSLADLVMPKDGRSGYFGMISNQMDFTIQYLYVSGAKIYVDIENAPETSNFTECGYLTHGVLTTQTTLTTQTILTTEEFTQTTRENDENDSEDNKSDRDIEEMIKSTPYIAIAAGVICCILCIFLRCQRKKVKRKTEKRYSKELEEEKKRIKALEEEKAELEEKLNKLTERACTFEMEQPGSFPHDATIPGYTSKKSLELSELNMEDINTQNEEQKSDKITDKTDGQPTTPMTPMTPMTLSEGVEGIPVVAKHNPDTEGYEAGTVTQLNSAVRLNLDIPHAAYASKKNVHQNMDGNNTGDDEENMMDEMLMDVLEMQTSDPNKIHEMNVNNMVVDKAQDSSDSDSDYMYHKEEKKNDHIELQEKKKMDPDEDSGSAPSFSASSDKKEAKITSDERNNVDEEEKHVIPQDFVVSKMNVIDHNNDDSDSDTENMYVKNVNNEESQSNIDQKIT